MKHINENVQIVDMQLLTEFVIATNLRSFNKNITKINCEILPEMEWLYEQPVLILFKNQVL